MKDVGVYIHIPFCKSKCYYCDFISFPNCESKIEKYINLLKNEINSSEQYNAKTIYFGGGTPSYIEAKYIKDILDVLSYNDVEITIEINPGTVNKQKLEDYFNMGINRISIGLQTTNNNLLQEIGRIHKYEDFLSTYEMARNVGFENINVDLIISLPNQTLVDVEDSINKIVLLNPEHVSVYSLILEEKTKLYSLIENKLLKMHDDDLERKMYWNAKNKLEEAGYIHYEISNFAKKGFECRHNLDCWEQKEYIGYGLGAHSYIDNTRFCNTSNIDEYMKVCKIINEVQTDYTKMQEYVMLGLRKINGISIKKFNRKFGINIYDVFKDELIKLFYYNLLEEKDNIIKLTYKGIDLANIVWEEFV